MSSATVGRVPSERGVVREIPARRPNRRRSPSRAHAPAQPLHRARLRRAQARGGARRSKPGRRARPRAHAQGPAGAPAGCTPGAARHPPRRRFGGLTPAEIDSLAPRAEDPVCRARFYADACAPLACVARQVLDNRARCRAEREVVLSMLEAHSLVVRTRGDGRSSRPSKRNLEV